ncbi:MAG: sulfatase-like hydrolase/transferase [Pseudomonadota bacterium]
MTSLKRTLVPLAAALIAISSTANAKDIVHDAEHYVLLKQYKDQWAAQDEEIAEKLEALREKHGTPPNIIHIMWDDTPVGEVGIPHLQKNRGFETPNMNQFAAEGIYFSRMYTEPSCTPSRAAAMTGRHAVRNGMYNVGFPYEYGGLAADEVTIAEVLSEVGYATAFYGKSHLGDVESSYLHRQGFDEAHWTPYNQVPSLYVPRAQRGVLTAGVMLPEMFPEDPYDLDKGWRPKGYIWSLVGVKGGPTREWTDAGVPPMEEEGYYALEQTWQDKTIAFMEKNAAENKPFFIAYWPNINSFLNIRPTETPSTVSYGVLQEGLANIDRFVGRLTAALDEAGVAENTLVILMADNGPMTHNGPPGMVEALYRGGKGDYFDGAVRVPALARWPGVIEEGQIVGDIIHITDLFTTFANLGGALDEVPTDRIIDGVNQTALFLEGDTQSRRDYVHIYTGPILAASVKGRYKKHWAGAKPGLSGPEFYDLYNDPREHQGQLLPMFPAKSMFNQMKMRHLLMKEEYPDQGQNRDFPFRNIENARPETIEASQPRVDPDDVPFDPADVIRNVPEWENTEANWGIGSGGDG